MWNQHLVKGLTRIGFKQSNVDECLFYRGCVLFAVYTDDGILCSPSNEAIDKVIEDINDAGFDIEDQGDLADYLGVNIERMDDGRIKLTQPHLIDQILEHGSHITASNNESKHHAHQPRFSIDTSMNQHSMDDFTIEPLSGS